MEARGDGRAPALSIESPAALSQDDPEGCPWGDALRKVVAMGVFWGPVLSSPQLTWKLHGEIGPLSGNIGGGGRVLRKSLGVIASRAKGDSRLSSREWKASRNHTLWPVAGSLPSIAFWVSPLPPPSWDPIKPTAGRG